MQNKDESSMYGRYFNIVYHKQVKQLEKKNQTSNDKHIHGSYLSSKLRNEVNWEKQFVHYHPHINYIIRNSFKSCYVSEKLFNCTKSIKSEVKIVSLPFKGDNVKIAFHVIFVSSDNILSHKRSEMSHWGLHVMHVSKFCL